MRLPRSRAGSPTAYYHGRETVAAPLGSSRRGCGSGVNMLMCATCGQPGAVRERMACIEEKRDVG